MRGVMALVATRRQLQREFRFVVRVCQERVVALHVF